MKTNKKLSNNKVQPASKKQTSILTVVSYATFAKELRDNTAHDFVLALTSANILLEKAYNPILRVSYERNLIKVLKVALSIS